MVPDWMLRAFERFKKYLSERRLSCKLDYSGSGVIRVDANWLIRQPKVQKQIQELNRLIKSGAIQFK